MSHRDKEPIHANHEILAQMMPRHPTLLPPLLLLLLSSLLLLLL
jgi:hypothetical protein